MCWDRKGGHLWDLVAGNGRGGVYDLCIGMQVMIQWLFPFSMAEPGEDDVVLTCLL